MLTGVFDRETWWLVGLLVGMVVATCVLEFVRSRTCWSVSGEQGVIQLCGCLKRHEDGSLSVGDVIIAAGSWTSVKEVKK